MNLHTHNLNDLYLTNTPQITFLKYVYYDIDGNKINLDVHHNRMSELRKKLYNRKILNNKNDWCLFDTIISHVFIKNQKNNILNSYELIHDKTGLFDSIVEEVIEEIMNNGIYNDCNCNYDSDNDE